MEQVLYYFIFYITLRIACIIYLTLKRIEYLHNLKGVMRTPYIDGVSTFGFIVTLMVGLNPFIRTLDNSMKGNHSDNYDTNRYIFDNDYLSLSRINPYINIIILLLTSIYTNAVFLMICLDIPFKK